LFREAIMDIYDREGNRSWITYMITLSKWLEKCKGNSFLECYMQLCKKYNIAYYGIIQENETEPYQVIISVNAYHSLALQYQDEKSDIAVPLANALSIELRAMIMNKKYLDEVKLQSQVS
jgi:hypothetical protein